MLRSKEKIAYNAAKPSEKAHVVILFGDQLQISKGRIAFLIQKYAQTESNQLIPIQEMGAAPSYSLAAFNEITKLYDLDFSKGWIDSLLNPATMDVMLLNEVGANGDNYYGTTSEDWEIVEPKS